ncbi:hypothetical protein JCM2811A_13930 [Methylorubrum rhodinum]
MSVDQLSKHEPTWWLGDVWKIVPILKKYRADLKLYVVSAPPTGLVLVSNLNPQCTILKDNYAQIIEEMASMNFDDLLAYTKSIKLLATSELSTFEGISKYFYL